MLLYGAYRLPEVLCLNDQRYIRDLSELIENSSGAKQSASTKSANTVKKLKKQEKASI